MYTVYRFAKPSSIVLTEPGPLPVGFCSEAVRDVLFPDCRDWQEALYEAFPWHLTHQGFDFWSREADSVTLSDAGRSILSSWLALAESGKQPSVRLH